MRIVIITAGVSRILDPLLDSGHQVVGVMEPSPRHKRGLIKEFLFQLGLSYFRVIKKDEKSLSVYCRKKDIPYRRFTKDYGTDDIEWLRALNPDLLVVYSMSFLLKEDIYALPPFGTINLHPSYLPSYRGPFPLFWQYYDTLLDPGVTVHYIDKKEDTGDIIYQEKVNVDLGITSPQLMDLLIGSIGSNLLVRAIDGIENGTAPRIQQPKETPSVRARNIKESEHDNLIDWEAWPVEKIWHLLRGTQSWLNAFEQPSGIFYGQRWKIGSFLKCDMTGIKPKKIIKESGNRYLTTRDGKIEVSIKFNIILFIKNFILRK